MTQTENKNQKAILALEDGSIFYGLSIGYPTETTGEIIFNTAMTGYQEILTDPSYAKQLITFTHPHIGNVGTNTNDKESDTVWTQGLILQHLSPIASNWRSEQSLSDYLIKHHIPAISHIDTRQLTHILRTKGALRGCITPLDTATNPSNRHATESYAIKKAQSIPSLKGLDLAKTVSTTSTYTLEPPAHTTTTNNSTPLRVVVYDYGVKQNILRLLLNRHCTLTVVPANTPAESVLALKPNGVLLSNGPGDPAACHYAIQAIQTLLNKNIPIFGICLGYQLLAIACGAKTYKMRFGHHGANHPVQDLLTQKVIITTQNHGFAVDENTLPRDLRPTHRSLFDNTLQGITHTNKPAFAFQGHPEASPGPHDAQPLFDQFIHNMQHHRQ